MGTMTETGTEKRVDELSKRVDVGFEEMSKRVDFGFAQVDRRFEQIDRRFEQVDRRFEQIDQRFDRFEASVDRRFDRVEDDARELRSEMKSGFDSLHRLMIRFFAGTVGSIIAGVVVLLLSHS
jgi:hypothetical protein